MAIRLCHHGMRIRYVGVARCDVERDPQATGKAAHPMISLRLAEYGGPPENHRGLTGDGKSVQAASMTGTLGPVGSPMLVAASLTVNRQPQRVCLRGAYRSARWTFQYGLLDDALGHPTDQLERTWSYASGSTGGRSLLGRAHLRTPQHQPHTTLPNLKAWPELRHPDDRPATIRCR